MKKVMILYDHLLDLGGVETHLLGLIEHSPEPFRFVIVSPFSLRFQKKAEALGAALISWTPRKPLDPRNLPSLARIVRQEQPALIHIHGANAAVPGRIVARLYRIPCVLTVHLPVTQYHGERQTPRARAGRQLYTRVDAFLNHALTEKLIYVSGQVYKEAIASGQAPRSKALVIPNGIDLVHYDCPSAGVQLRQRMGIPPGCCILAFAGRLDRQKGADLLLEALALLEPRGLDYLLWIIGDGRERKALEEQVGALHLQEKVRFWGHQEDIDGLLNASNLFVLPSRYEAMPIALLEALASGLPCVVTDVGENRSVIEDQVQGLVVAPGQAGPLAEAIASLVAHPSLCQQMGEAARKKAREYNLPEMVGRTVEVYRSAASC